MNRPPPIRIVSLVRIVPATEFSNIRPELRPSHHPPYSSAPPHTGSTDICLLSDRTRTDPSRSVTCVHAGRPNLSSSEVQVADSSPHIPRQCSGLEPIRRVNAPSRCPPNVIEVELVRLVRRVVLASHRCAFQTDRIQITGPPLRVLMGA